MPPSFSPQYTRIYVQFELLLQQWDLADDIFGYNKKVIK